MPTPTENTLTVNTTHQMLSYLEGEFQTLTALSPTREMENVLGYDINLPLLKLTVFQYKRPYTVKDDPCRRFKINSDQWRTLISLYEQRQAFFTLPEVVNAQNLDDALRKRTLFVDVWGLHPRTSLIYVPEDAIRSNRVNQLNAKVRNGPTYQIDSRAVYTWEDIVNGLDDCTVGLQMLENGERTENFHTFKSRVMALSDDEVSTVLNRLESVVYEQQFIDLDMTQDEVTFQYIQGRLNELVDQDTDLATHGIKRSQHTLLGR